jgi:hypothetical protein
MTTEWNFACVTDIQQSQLAELVSKAIEKWTDGKLLHVAKPSHSFSELASGWGEVVYLLPKDDLGASLIGQSHRLIWLLCKQCHLTSIMLGRHSSEDGLPTDCWSYTVWQEGVPVEWFVSKPLQFFSNWAMRNLLEYVLPHLEMKKIPASLIGSTHTEIAEAFSKTQGKTALLRAFLKSEIEEDQIEAWLQSPADIAIKKAPELLRSQYMNIDYNIQSLSLFFDAKQGCIGLLDEKKAGDDQEVVKQYNNLVTAGKIIDDITPLGFEWGNGANPMSRINEYGNLFYWG